MTTYNPTDYIHSQSVHLEAYKQHMTKYKSNASFNDSPENDLFSKKSMEFSTQQSPTKSKDLVMRENEQLKQQIVNIEKAYIKKKTECELWKQKYENQISQNLKESTLTEFRNMQESQIKQLQMNRLQENSICRSQITQDTKQLTNLLQQKNQEIQDLHLQLNKQKVNADNTFILCQKEIDSLRIIIQNHEVEKQNEIQNIKSRLELQADKNVENIKLNYTSQFEIKEQEMLKMKQVLDIKNSEIDTLINQNQRIRQNYEEECDLLRNDIEMLKTKLIEGEKQQEQLQNEIIESIQIMHNEDIDYLKITYIQNTEGLQNEIILLQQLLQQKKEEIEQLYQFRSDQLINQDKDIENLKKVNQQQATQIQELQANFINQQEEFAGRTARHQATHTNEITLMQNQLQTIEAELQQTRNHVKDKNQEIESIRGQSSSIQSSLQQDIVQLQFLVSESKAFSSNHITDKDLEIEKLKQEICHQENQLGEVQNQYEMIINHLNQELRRQQETFAQKIRECESVNIQRSQLEIIIQKQQTEIACLNQKLKDFQTAKVQEMEDLKQKMDTSSSMQFENLKSAYNTQIRILQEQIQDLQMQYEKRNREYEEFVDKFLNQENSSNSGTRRIMEVMAQSHRLRSGSRNK